LPTSTDKSLTSQNATPITSNEPIQVNNTHETFYWGNKRGLDFTIDLNFAYEKIVHWRQNLFLVPSGQSGKKFIREVTRLINSWVDNSSIKGIAFKAIMVMPALSFQTFGSMGEGRSR